MGGAFWVGGRGFGWVEGLRGEIWVGIFSSGEGFWVTDDFWVVVGCG